nr:hypothetical protein [Pseudarthrobacter sp. IC2-21]
MVHRDDISDATVLTRLPDSAVQSGRDTGVFWQAYYYCTCGCDAFEYGFKTGAATIIDDDD